MLFKKLVDLCKKRKWIEIIKGDNARWLSDGRVYASLGEDAKLDIADIMYIMEIPEEREDAFVTSEMEFTEDDTHIFNPKSAEKMDRTHYSLNCDGLTLQPFGTSQGIVFLNTKHTSIFKDTRMKEYYLSEFKGEYIVLVAVDNLTIGMIRPHRVDLETMKAFSSGFDELVRCAHEKNFLDSGDHQYSLIDE